MSYELQKCFDDQRSVFKVCGSKAVFTDMVGMLHTTTLEKKSTSFWQLLRIILLLLLSLQGQCSFYRVWYNHHCYCHCYHQCHHQSLVLLSLEGLCLCDVVLYYSVIISVIPIVIAVIIVIIVIITLSFCYHHHQHHRQCHHHYHHCCYYYT